MLLWIKKKDKQAKCLMMMMIKILSFKVIFEELVKSN